MIRRSLRSAPAAAAAVLALVGPAAAVTVTDIPSPRPWGWVVDLTRTLPQSSVVELNRLGDRVHGETGAELAVVVVPSVDGADPRDFAVRLFNLWGIGRAGSDDGVLVFVALEDRAAEIVLGDGVAGAVQQRASDEIIAGIMVPRFRSGRPAQAVVEGTRACARRILGLEALPLEQPPRAAAAGEDSVRRRSGALPAPVAKALQVGWGLLWSALVLLGTAGVAAWGVWRSRRCPGCRGPLTKLDEVADDAYLTDPEKAEESVGSVDHQVSWCAACQRVVKRRRVKLFSGYVGCGQCGARTNVRRETTLRAATEWSEGLARVDFECAHCGHTSSGSYTTPRLSPPDRRSSSDRSSRSSRSSSGGSSRSSGFGGGRSSGRGSSGRW